MNQISNYKKSENKKTISKYKTLIGKFKKVIGAGVLAFSVAMGNSIISGKDPITVGIVGDIAEDTFENAVPVYSAPDSKILATVTKDGTLVVVNEEIEKDDKKFIKVSLIDNKNKKITGYINSEHMKNSVSIDSDYSLYKVVSENGVNLRNLPKTVDSDKISALPNGTIVLGKNENESWSKVIYITKNAMHVGYSATKYLQSIENEIKQENNTPYQENINKYADNTPAPEIKYNVQNGNVFGIDIEDLPPKMFEEILTGKRPIKQRIQTTRIPEVNLGKYPNRKPDFVYLKLAASGYGAKEIKQGRQTQFKKLSEICEKLGVPYGFYYYSTCTNEQEAETEYKWIDEHMSTLEKTKYNLLPLVLDVEITDKNDRQFRVSREQLTNSKIKLANLVEQKHGKTILYSAMNTLETILDIEKYQKGLDSGNSGVWLVSPSKRFLQLPQVMAEYEKVKEHVLAEQIVLDAFIVPPKREIIYPGKEAKNDKKNEITIKGPKTAKLSNGKDKNKVKVADRKKAKDAKKEKGKSKKEEIKKDKNKDKDKSKELKQNKEKKEDKKKEPEKGKQTMLAKPRDYIIDINVFNAKMFEKCIKGEYKKMGIENAMQKNAKLLAEAEKER